MSGLQPSILSATPSNAPSQFSPLSAINVTVVTLPKETKPIRSSFFSGFSSTGSAKEITTVSNHSIALPNLPIEAHTTELRQAVEASVDRALDSANNNIKYRDNEVRSVSNLFLDHLKVEPKQSIAEVLVPGPDHVGIPTIHYVESADQRIASYVASHSSASTKGTSVASLGSVGGEALKVLVLQSGDGKALIKGITVERISAFCSWLKTAIAQCEQVRIAVMNPSNGDVYSMRKVVLYNLRNLSAAFRTECIPGDQYQAKHMKKQFGDMTDGEKSNYIRWKVYDAVDWVYKLVWQLDDWKDKWFDTRATKVLHSLEPSMSYGRYIPELKKWSSELKKHVAEYELKGVVSG